jgi:hypothetical protein
MPLLVESQKDVHMPKKIDPAVKERALRMFVDLSGSSEHCGYWS